LDKSGALRQTVASIGVAPMELPIPTFVEPWLRTMETKMSDNNQKQAQDRKLVAGGEKYEVSYFAKKHGLELKDAKRIIDAHGPDRDAADKAAQRFKH
jgi:hypothetical protein